MSRFVRVVIYLSSAAFAFPGVAVASGTGISNQNNVYCAPHSEMVQLLKDRFGAARQGRGMYDPDTLIELWWVQASGNWTLVKTYADGRACVLATGEDWEPLSAEPPA